MTGLRSEGEIFSLFFKISLVLSRLFVKLFFWDNRRITWLLRSSFAFVLNFLITWRSNRQTITIIKCQLLFIFFLMIIPNLNIRTRTWKWIILLLKTCFILNLSTLLLRFNFFFCLESIIYLFLIPGGWLN